MRKMIWTVFSAMIFSVFITSMFQAISEGRSASVIGAGCVATPPCASCVAGWNPAPITGPPAFPSGCLVVSCACGAPATFANACIVGNVNSCPLITPTTGIFPACTGCTACACANGTTKAGCVVSQSNCGSPTNLCLGGGIIAITTISQYLC